ncbi:MAG: 3-isopropylmalate dehydrogenase [Chloroflexi bacterium]|nr:MAG: 3-isopropylmalate dehydrogenase [Chloroflexota bacterium]
MREDDEKCRNEHPRHVAPRLQGGVHKVNDPASARWEGVLVRFPAPSRDVKKSYKLGVIGGDGIGPEVTEVALHVLDACERRFRFRTERTSFPWSGAHFLKTGERLTPDKLAPIRAQDAVLLGAIGHPDVPRGMIERDVVIGLRRGLDLYVNLRPVILYDDRLSPLRTKGSAEIHMTVIRENTEDVYAATGERTAIGTPAETATVPMRFTRPGVERILRYAFELASRSERKHLTLVDKANAITVQEIWREVFEELGSQYPSVQRDAMYVDAAAMWMVLKPEQFDVIVTTNLFGDILSDLGAALAGGLGTAASGNIHPGRVSVFEPIHGSAPKYAGKGVASPIAAIGALAMLLEHLGEVDAAHAIDSAIRNGLRTGRIKGVEAGLQRTEQVGDVIEQTIGG